jgi:hypothetical protein
MKTCHMQTQAISEKWLAWPLHTGIWPHACVNSAIATACCACNLAPPAAATVPLAAQHIGTYTQAISVQWVAWPLHHGMLHMLGTASSSRRALGCITSRTHKHAHNQRPVADVCIAHMYTAHACVSSAIATAYCACSSALLVPVLALSFQVSGVTCKRFANVDDMHHTACLHNSTTCPCFHQRHPSRPTFCCLQVC